MLLILSKLKIRCPLFQVTLVDMLINFGMYLNPSTTDQAIRVSRVLRPLFFINMNESKQVRKILLTKDLENVFLLLPNLT